MAAVVALVAICQRPVHVAHVSSKEEIDIIRDAKERKLPVTCEVCPHHLFLSTEKFTGLRSNVRPPLRTEADRQALWANMDIIDCFATDHGKCL